MSDTALETIYPWISSYRASSNEPSLPKHAQEAGNSSELWAVRIPTGLNTETLQASKWEKSSHQSGGLRWMTNIDGRTYFLEQVSMKSPCYAIDKKGTPLMSPVVHQMVIYASNDGDLTGQTRDSKRKRKK